MFVEILDLVSFIANWVPVTLWVVLCFRGIVNGVKELSECSIDLEFVEADATLDQELDPSIDVANGNFTSALKLTAVQATFLLIAVIAVVLQLVYPSPYNEVDLVRSIVLPVIFITSEYLLSSHIKDLGRTRKRVKAKARKAFLETQH